MKTMDRSTLETLIANHEPIDLIDIRPRSEFNAMHIRGARSLPVTELTARKIFRRQCLAAGHVYIVSDDPASASLATGILNSSGTNAIAVDGGIKAWLARGLPVLRKKSSFNLATF